ncbi:MAG: aminotransferase class IV [Deltaproteobacteria bacterium]|nr:aminotransferase class IV [Deltaproteobacteria bacterium]
MNNIVFLNGKFLPADKALVSVFDRGFAYGDGIFETMRSYNGMVFALDLHLERLTNATKTIGIPFKSNKKYLSGCLKKLLELNDITTGNTYIKLTISRGVDYGGIAPSAELKPTIAIIAKPLDVKIHKNFQQKGIGAVFLSDKRSIPHIKSLNLLPNVMGLLQAKKTMAQEGIFTDGNKILEGAITNIFIYDGRCIKTPPLSDGILPGVTRRLVIELAKNQGVRVEETSLTKNELIRSKEAFLTNSIIEIAPLVKIEDNSIGNGKVGALTRRLQQAYRDMVLKRLNP